jgi:hypothetical protein
MRLFLAAFALVIGASNMALAVPVRVEYNPAAMFGYGAYTMTTAAAWKPAGPVTPGANGVLVLRASDYVDKPDHATLTIKVWTMLPGDVIAEKMRNFSLLPRGNGAISQAVSLGPYTGEMSAYPTSGQAGGPSTAFIALKLGMGYFEATAQYPKPPSEAELSTMEQMLGSVRLLPQHRGRQHPNGP